MTRLLVTEEKEVASREPPREKDDGARLFRSAVGKSRGRAAFGEPAVTLPPGAAVTALLALSALLLLAVAVWVVQIPQSARAIGVIMPSSGIIPIDAPAGGVVSQLMVQGGDRADEGEVLLRIAAAEGLAAELTFAEARLSSLHHEWNLRQRASEFRQRRAQQQLAMIDTRLSMIERRIRVIAREVALRESGIQISQRQYERSAALADSGGVSPERLDQLRALALREQIEVQDAEARLQALLEQQNRLQSERSAAAMTIDVNRLEVEVEREQLHRQILESELRHNVDITAPRKSTVSRVHVVEGESVQPGQSLLSLQAGSGELQAWLYVGSRDAGSIRPGQKVELRIDAFPHELYGTQRAVVESVSAIALKPVELKVPLGVSGPVFEVRTRLLSDSIAGANDELPLLPGLALQADIFQNRRRLYQWLLHRVTARDGAPDV